MIHFQHSYFIVLTMKKILASIFCFFFIFIWWVFAEESKSCSTSTGADNFCSPEFKIEVNEFTPVKYTFVWSGQTLSDFFNYVINDLMVGLWVIALLIMSVWAGYMIFYHGQDEYLSKGKSIFMAGIIALVVALSSYFLVNLLRFILYS